MAWSNQLKTAISTKLKSYDLYFSPDDVPADIIYPASWSGFGFQGEDKKFIPCKWADFSSLLPWVCDWLDKCVIGTLLAVGDGVYLVYVYREDGEIYFYMGGAPLIPSEAQRARLKFLPETLQDFYMQLHDGFGFYIGYAMGPSRVRDFIAIDEICDEEGIEYPGVLAIFSSGAGDYLCIDENPDNTGALIWWHEEPDNPSRGESLWNMMDGWMCVFLENSDSNEE